MSKYNFLSPVEKNTIDWHANIELEAIKRCGDAKLSRYAKKNEAYLLSNLRKKYADIALLKSLTREYSHLMKMDRKLQKQIMEQKINSLSRYISMKH
jgi:hypothetical protein